MLGKDDTSVAVLVSDPSLKLAIDRRAHDCASPSVRVHVTSANRSNSHLNTGASDHNLGQPNVALFGDSSNLGIESQNALQAVLCARSVFVAASGEGSAKSGTARSKAADLALCVSARMSLHNHRTTCDTLNDATAALVCAASAVELGLHKNLTTKYFPTNMQKRNLGDTTTNSSDLSITSGNTTSIVIASTCLFKINLKFKSKKKEMKRQQKQVTRFKARRKMFLRRRTPPWQWHWLYLQRATILHL
jgi:hypothetical protein